MTNLNFGRARSLRCGVSLWALVAMGAAPATQAQTGNGNGLGSTSSQLDKSNSGKVDEPIASSPAEIVIVGVREALKSAQSRKKNADTVIDSINSTDIGAFPDNSVSSALQRVPGISVNRLQASDDSTHPSGEPTGVLIRGLTFVRTEFNGRDSFNAGSGGLNFQDVTPELIHAVDVYKNQTADLIEGGIAGTVDLRTRLPFDQKGFVATANFKGTYGDRGGHWNGEGSGLISKTFVTPIGKFGLLADYAYSHLITRTETVYEGRVGTFCSQGALNAATGRANMLADGSIACTGNVFGGKSWAYVPESVNFSKTDYDRTRKGVALAGQYENNAGNLRASVQYLRSSYLNAWQDNTATVSMDGGAYHHPAWPPLALTTLRSPAGAGPYDPTVNNVRVVNGYNFDASGVLQSVDRVGAAYPSWRPYNQGPLESALATGSAVPGLPFVSWCGDGTQPVGSQSCSTPDRQGTGLGTQSRYLRNFESTRDISAKFEWDPSDQLHFVLDGQLITSRTRNTDVTVFLSSLTDFSYRTDTTGMPTIGLLPGTNVNYAPGGLANPHNYYIAAVMDHMENNDASEHAIKGSVKYDFKGKKWFSSLQIGARYSRQENTIRNSGYNYNTVSAPYLCNGPQFNADNTTGGGYPVIPGTDCQAGRSDFKGWGQGLFGPSNFNSGFFNGTVLNTAGNGGALVFANPSAIKDYGRLISGLSRASTGAVGNGDGGWTPLCNRDGVSIDNCFMPSEVSAVTLTTKAAYARLNFGGPDAMIGRINMRGNVGIRVVQSEVASVGSIGFPRQQDVVGAFNLPCGAPLPTGQVVNPTCYRRSVDAFINGFNADGVKTKSSYTNFLPSLNVLLGVDKYNYVRFGYSKAMSRPNLRDLSTFTQISMQNPDVSATSPYLIKDGSGNINGYNFLFQTTRGNPGLKPTTADQLDLTFEHYRGVTAYHMGVFYKKLYNTVGNGQFDLSFQNNGSTQTVRTLTMVNVKDGGQLLGAEVGGNTFFTFLPGLLSGLGLEANYTFVKQIGIHATVSQSTADGLSTGALIDAQQLPSLSKHTFNVVGLYEKGPVAIRLAYNWRSRFLTNNLDCCVWAPVFQKSSGFLDASLRYSPAKWLELSIEANNLLDTTLVYQQQIFGYTTTTPDVKPRYQDTNWSRLDRRFQFGARMKF